MLTLSTCFYIVKSKFNVEKYQEWIYNFISNVNNFNLVIYTDEKSYKVFDKFNSIINDNSKIKIIFKNMDQFFTYKYKDYWIKNQAKNTLLKNIDWELEMIWAEKIFFVEETINNKYFDSEYYGWCDIGYFRNRSNDLTINQLKSWPNNNKILNLDRNKIYYARINNDNNYFWSIIKLIINKNSNGLPITPIPSNQTTIAGGFFLIHNSKINWWKNTFINMLELYFNNNYLVKDDQIIIINCIANNFRDFELIQENNIKYDNWFLFQRYLL